MKEVDEELAKALMKIDKWLFLNQPYDLTNTVEASREIITKIQERGYYSEYERELLNELREQYLKDKNNENS
jgi:hypothetical protein